MAMDTTEMTAPTAGRVDASEPEPAWDVARLFPAQGHWSEEEYLALSTNRLVEFSHGTIEVLSMPTQTHQLILAFLYEALVAFIRPRSLGLVLFAGIRVRLSPGKIREPDIVFMSREHAARRRDDCWDGVDLAMEVVSADDPKRDLEIKRLEYARAGVAEYWIVDPRTERILVLSLDGESYRVHGDFGRGSHSTSVLFSGFSISTDAVFDAAQAE